MIIAVITVRMVQPAVYEVIDVIAMRHLFMSAAWTVSMRALDLRGAAHGICGIDRDDMFVHMILVHMVKMTIVKIVHMAVMANRGVSAIRAMAAANPVNCTPQVHCSHTHGPGCGHAQVPHGDHVDYLVDGRLHHPHGDHCDDHGPLQLA
jgi:hypothetical protein